MTRRPPPFLFLALVLACGCSRDAGLEAAAPPDVVLITIDTLRADHLGCYGYPRNTSPRIDKLAAEGVLFETAVASSTYTGPSVASILTGRYPRFNSYGYSNIRARLLPTEDTLADAFLEAGYRTAGFVCNPVLSGRTGMSQGFELYDDSMDETEAIRTDAPERTAPVVTPVVLDWIENADPADPLFLWVHLQDPHGPYLPPEGFEGKFRNEDPGPAVPGPDGEDDHGGQGRVPAYQAVREEHHLNEYVDRYDAEILAADHHVGLILDALKRRGKYDETVILFTADHGEAFGENGFYFAHGHDVTRDLSHVPFLLKHPDLEPGKRSGIPVGHVDVFPTLLASVASPARDGIEDSVDLIALLRQDEPTGPDRVLFCDVGSQLAAHGGEGFLVAGLKTREAKAITGLKPEDLHGLRLLDLHRAEPTPVDGEELQRRLHEAARRYLEQPAAEFASLIPKDLRLKKLRALGYVED